MKRSLTSAALLAVLVAVGCNLAGPNRRTDEELAHYKQLTQTVDHADLTTPASWHAETPAPRTIRENALPSQWWEITVEEAVQIALQNSSVLHDLGGTIVRAPEAQRTILNPAVVSSDPRFGIEAALSAFDAQVATAVNAEKNDRMVNNFISSGGARVFQQDLINFQSQISKQSAAGTQTTLRGISVYDNNNATFNKFPSTWDTLIEAEIRQPFGQGAGVQFNRLAGPNSFPGFYNGVLIARVNTDISAADFEIGLRDLVSNVENAYWDLYFAFRDLDAKILARNAALDAWKRVQIMIQSGQPGGTPEREAQAREQYFRYEEDVQNSLTGKLHQATVTNNGSSGGSFQGTGGVLVCERRLRLAIGLPITDGRMIRPADEPTLAEVVFDWPTASGDAIDRRPELLRQRLFVKRREMELVASRNFLLPRFDMVGRYRVRGLGKGLIGDADVLPDPQDPSNFFGHSSLANLTSGNFQEWLVGGEVTMPIGYRRAHAGVRNAQLNLARDKAILEEQERQIIHDLSNAVSDLDRAYQAMQTSYNRRLAAVQNVEILRQRMESDRPVTPEQLLDAERRLSESDIQYHRDQVEHMLALKNVHFEKGTLLEYEHVMLSEDLPNNEAAPPATQPIPVPAAEEPAPVEPPPTAQPPMPQAPLPQPIAPPRPALPVFTPPQPAPQPIPQPMPPPIVLPGPQLSLPPAAPPPPVTIPAAPPLAPPIPTPAQPLPGPPPMARTAVPEQSILRPRMDSLPPLPPEQAAIAPPLPQLPRRDQVPPQLAQPPRLSTSEVERTLFDRPEGAPRAPATSPVVAPAEPPPGTAPTWVSPPPRTPWSPPASAADNLNPQRLPPP
ncbi:MAG: TolC family protein [Pirellulaceae bacterium]|nr:TolC family protein [Pirellulaceae bacterium]